MEKKIKEKIIEILKPFSANQKVAEAFADQILDLFSNLLDEIVPEEGIKWMQEGNHKDRKGYTEGFNACRQVILEKINQLK